MTETKPTKKPVDNRSFEQVLHDLMPEWADTVMMQVQSKQYRQVVFWPVRLFDLPPHEGGPSQ